MANIIKKYFKGGLNSDVDPDILPEGDYLNALNVKIGASSDGSAGILRLAKGHTKQVSVADAKDNADNAEVSTEDVKHMVVDEENGDIYIFKSGSVIGGGGTATPVIYRSSPPYTSIVVILEEGAVVGWEPTGNTDFKWGSFVSGKKVGDNLIWINDKGYQFSLNVEAWRNVYQSEDANAPGFLGEDLGISDISLIKRPPARQLTATKQTDLSYTKNFTKDFVFQFGYRYTYVGGEVSAMSPLSVEIDVNVEGQTYNYIQVDIPYAEVIPQSVRSVEVICKNKSTGGINIVKRWDAMILSERNLIVGHINGDAALGFRFYNDKVYESVDDAYFVKQFDSVPVKSYSLEIAKDRLFLANNVEGYDTPKSISLTATTNTDSIGDSKTLDIYEVDLVYGVQVQTDDGNGGFIYSYEDHWYSTWAVYAPTAGYPGWYELYTEGGYGSYTDLSITYPGSGFQCTLNSTSTNLSTLIGSREYIYLSGFTNSGNNGLFRISGTPTSTAATLNAVRFLSPTPSAEAAGASITVGIKGIKISSSDVSPYATRPSSSVNLNTLTYMGTSLADFAANAQLTISEWATGRSISSGIATGITQLTSQTSTDTTFNLTVTGFSGVSTRPFKTDSRYAVGIQFYDWAMRKCGVYTNDNLLLTVGNRAYALNTALASIAWSLPSGTQTEIPTWAKYYSIVRSDNLSTRYFIQGETVYLSASNAQLSYAKKDADGVWDVNTAKLTWDGTISGIALDLEPVLNKGFGYVYQAGDILKLYNKDNAALNVELKIIDTVGRYIIADPYNLSTLDDTDKEWRYEIRRPYKPSEDEPFFETSIYEVDNWGTNTRAYSVKSGLLSGDIYVDNALEYMSLNQRFRTTWSRGLGRPCFVDRIGQVHRKNGIRWSNTFIPGTLINGVSTFEALDYEDLPVELGPINKLQITSKVQSEGSVMLAIGQNRTASMYLGETTVIDNTGQSLLATSGKVIGTVNILKGIYGTTCPSSVVEYDGIVYWADILNEVVVRYSSNGLYPISDNNMKNFFRNYFKKKKTEINEYDITQSPYLYGGYNPLTDEYVLAFAPCSESADNYPDSSAKRYHDIRMMYRTGTPAGSIAFSAGDEVWTTFYSHGGPYVTFGGKMISFVKSKYTNPDGERVAGGLFIFEKDSADGSFGGATKQCFISFPINEAPNNIKIFNALSVEGTLIPDETFIETTKPNNQITNLTDGDWNLREGIYYADLYRDRLSPNKSGSADEKMFKGDKMRGNNAFVTMRFSDPDPFYIRFINIKIKDSIGHDLIQQ
jgi:hypothetical protein